MAQRVPQETVTEVAVLDFDAFFAEQTSGLTKLSLMLQGDRESAEDVVQDVLLEVYRRWSTFTGYGQALMYARTAVVNRSRSVLRRRSVAGRWAPRLVQRDDDGGGADASSILTTKAALAALPRRQREVLVLRFWLDLPEKDVAALLGISVGAVKSTASKAKSALAEKLSEQS